MLEKRIPPGGHEMEPLEALAARLHGRRKLGGIKAIVDDDHAGVRIARAKISASRASTSVTPSRPSQA